MNIIFDFNRTIFNPDTMQLHEGALETLDFLKSKGHTLQLISRFVKKGRYEEIFSSGIAHYFENIFLVKEKTKAIFKVLSIGYESKTIVVGDIIREEIKIGNLLGFQTVWFRNGKFKDDKPSSDMEIPKFIILSLSDFANLEILE